MRALAISLAIGLALGAALVTRAQVLPTPASATGKVGIEGGITVSGGTINVGNTPTVEAKQVGPWRVEVTGTPPARLESPAFLRVGAQYRIIWSDQHATRCRVLNVSTGGWARVEMAAEGGQPPRRAWLNLGRALEVVELD